MMEVRDVLRRVGAGQTQRHVERDTGVARTTVARHAERRARSYATLRRFATHVLGWGMRAPPVRVDDPAPGDEAQVDFGPMGRMLDPESGRARKLWALIVTLSYGHYSFVYPPLSREMNVVCAGLNAAWTFVGGVPRRVVPDNMKTVAVGAHATSPRLHDAFTDDAQARGIFVNLARVRSPRTSPRREPRAVRTRERVRW